MEYSLWWEGPDYSKSPSSDWPKELGVHAVDLSIGQEMVVCVHSVWQEKHPIVSSDHFNKSI